jgi:hypothetical protein
VRRGVRGRARADDCGARGGERRARARQQAAVRTDQRVRADAREHHDRLPAPRRASRPPSAYRPRADAGGAQHAVQERELALVRAHERRLLERETGVLGRELGRATGASAGVARMAGALRGALRLAAGEDAAAAAALHGGGDAWGEAQTAAWALAREAELARLERENDELRGLVASAQMPPRPTAAA